MSSLLSDLWNGLPPLSDNLLQNDAETKHLIYLIDKHRQSLGSSLSPDQKEIFEKFADCCEEYIINLNEKTFCRGFSFACKLLAESIFRDD